MQTHHLDQLPGPGRRLAVPPGGAATLGVFDGVHLGHQAILARVRALADEVGGPAVVLTFAEHPVVVIRGLQPRLITSLPHRLRRFEEAGVDHCVVLPFDEEVRRLEAESFALRLFVEVLELRALALGPDARIGRDRQGDVTFLRSFCERHGIRFDVVDDLQRDGHRVSSTRIRTAIADGDLARAARMLGRPVSMLGTVAHGDGRGRTIGFPTANLDLHHEIRPPPGVYAVRAHVDGEVLPAVANVGVRPTFGPDGDLRVEVHVLDRQLDLYGQDLEIELVDRVRDELRFDSREALVAQIHRDVEAARRRLEAPDPVRPGDR